MRRIATWIQAWIFYWLGHFISILLNNNMEFLYPVYNQFINWSLFFNEWGNHNIWIDSKDE